MELYHFNPNHDRLGRFSRSGTGSTRINTNKRKQQNNSEGSKKKSFRLSDRQKTAIKIGAVAVGTALAVYGGYKVHQYIKDENRAYHLGREFRSKEYFYDRVNRFNKPSSEIIETFSLDFANRDLQSNRNIFKDGVMRTIDKADKDSFKTSVDHVKQMRKDITPYKVKRGWTASESLLKKSEEKVRRNRENQEFFRMVSKRGREYLDELWK